MFERLTLARNLLSKHGIIVINIDEHEQNNLSILMNQIFGEQNNLGEIIWNKGNPKGDAKAISTMHETIICYAKNKGEFQSLSGICIRKKPNAESIIKKANSLYKKIGKSLIPDDVKKAIKPFGYSKEIQKDFYVKYDLELVNKEFQNWLSNQNFSGGEKAYKYIDNKGRVYRGVSMAWPNKKTAPDDYFVPLIHPSTGKKCPVPSRGWRYPSTTMKKLKNQGLIIFGEDETKQPEHKYYLDENLFENVPSIYFNASSADNMLKDLDISFENAKPISEAKYVLSTLLPNPKIVLDFFAGSGTTAHAVMDINSKNNESRKFILVQLPQTIGEKEEAFKHGYKTICEIGEERIRRAGKKIKEETNANIDYGFRVFSLASSNMKDVFYKPSDVEQMNLLDYLSNVKEDRTPEDLLTQVMLDLGLTLDLKIEEKSILSNKVFYVEDNSLVACFDDQVDINIIDEICKCNPIKDISFKTDKDKINLEERIKKLSPETEINIL